jgi:uncharacterized pyridoxamine 5'-phosphate oxidase family protein
MSKRILFIANAEKISPNINGGGAVLFSHLELLQALGYDVVLLAVVWSESYTFETSDYEEVQDFVSEIVTYQADEGTFKSSIKRLYDALFNPTEFEYRFVNQNNRNYLQQIIKEKAIDLLWCEWRWAAIWAMTTSLNVPKIYSHHDWEFKLALLRKKPTLKKKFHVYQKKRVELQLVQQMDACVSGSQTEADEIHQISGKKVLYLPTTYESLTPKLKPQKSPSIVHLGGMGTTANRIGLERFLDVCWASIKLTIPNIQLVVVGSIKRAQPTLQTKLQDAQIQTLGFVQDLGTVLHPEDIHIIPWEHNTGTRTRIPVALNYEQALVTMRASAKCYPEVTEENAILCEDLEQMKEAIIHLYSDAEKLHLLATKGKQTFVENYTLKSQLKRLKTFLNQFIGEKND